MSSTTASLAPRAAPTPPPGFVAASYREHERFLWALSYRLTGSAADADDIVQETFVRALECPPARADEPVRPWLTRVALNLGRDVLRRRKRRPYDGPWLPSPIETEPEPPSFEIPGKDGTEGRYDLLESASFAFLIALEALTPQQRAVLLLRDVFDYSVQETAAALALSEASVKTTHHRARRALEPYDHDRDRCRPTPELVERSGAALVRFFQTLATQDVPAIEALLSEGVRVVNDANGEYKAARRIVVGQDRVARFYLGVTKGWNSLALRYELRLLNGLPALVIERHGPADRLAPRYVVRCDVDPSGRITAIHTVLASRKLTAVRPLSLP
ncbi:RNA polymerase sigma factor [Sorangium cellulosum]|uniref:RNA polymerase sigma factor n=1 Tax=Sorangium cellulosum TaxID=56 RepID=A0A2L0F896_SORCE|nr:sigma-70 family RNA polymerase sigma factor [Sorangium cellulosum]AUX47805.1 RNA polymerase sigma factor [Sorangium cellulosum]